MQNQNRVNKKAAVLLGMALFMLPSIKAIAQTGDNPSLATWDKAVLQQANTAATVTYLSDEEKEFIYYTNLCRLQPKLFCETVLTDYLKSHPEQNKGTAGLKRTLAQNKTMGAMVPDEEMCTMAKAYAKKMGAEGKEGHIDFEKRMTPFMKRFHKVGENCDYGNEHALDAFMNLLIDSSDPVSLGHRKNILDAGFTAVGAGVAPHKTYRWNYVMDFGG